jgi:cholesterol transport system auxiliary component
MIRTLLALMATAIALSLAGCSIPGTGDPPRLYVLSPKSTFDPNLPRADVQMLIEQPVAAAGLNTTRIALSRRPLSFEYYARASWTERAPNMVQTQLIESFERTKKILAVGRESIGLRADYILKTELRDFQAVYLGDRPDAVHVRINAKLVRMPDRAIVATETFDWKEPIRADQIDAIIDAWDEAAGKVMKRTVEWTLGNLARRPLSIRTTIFGR